MARAHFTLLSFILLGCLLGQTLAFNLREIPIAKDDEGLYLKTEFISTSRQDYPPTEAKFLLSFTHSEIIIADGCKFFSHHHCYDYHDYDVCYGRRGQNLKTVQHHMFTTEARPYNMDIYVNNTLWFNDKEKVLSASCNSGATFYGSKRDGVIGMRQNSWNYSLFSIYLNKNTTTGGKLLFGFDSFFAKSTQPLNFTANSTWQVEINEGSSFGLPNAMIPISGNLMFDPTATTIALPSRIYAYWMAYFKKVHNVDCWGGRGPHNDVCYYSGDISKLQPMILNVNGQRIEIPAHIYAKKTEYRNDIELNIRASDPKLSSDSYVEDAFKDSIILDSNVLRHYYAVFREEYNQNSIQLYLANHEVTPESTENSVSKKIMDAWKSLW